MNKTLSLIVIAITVLFSSCSDDSCDHITPPGPVTPDNWIEGLWYVEADNEEINYGNSGTYYDRYSNIELSGETEGRYQMDYANMKLTYRYSYLGNNLTKDWTVKNHTEFGFRLSSSDASGLDVEKIVEQHKLNVGESVRLKFVSERPDVKVTSFSSSNILIASVATDGTVTAMGCKGTTYIKMKTNSGNVWAKVTVGEDNKDLWCDYTSLIGADFNTMKQFFGRIGEPATNGIDYFVYIMSIHQYIESVNLLVDTENDVITAIQLFIKDGIPPVEIKSYLKSRYYEQEEFSFYSTQPDIEGSKAIVIYNQDNRCVTFFETQRTLHPELWHDFTKLFGSSKSDVKTVMDNYGYSFLMSDNSYSVDGSDYYSVTDNGYLTMAGFVFNPDKQVSEFWLYLNSKSNPNEIYNYLGHKFQENESESTDSSIVFYNEDKTLKVVFDIVTPAVVYTKLTMRQREANTEILGNYHEGLGLSHDQILDKFGSPYLDDGGQIYYWVGSDYVNLAAFNMNTETGKCKSAIITINESVATSTIVGYLNSKYTAFANGTASDGSQYAWTNGPSVAESTLGIIYYPRDQKVVYQSLGLAANTKARNISSCSINVDDNFVNQVKSKTFLILYNAKKTRNHLKMQTILSSKR